MEKLQFLTPEETVEVRDKFGTPTYVYDLARLKAGRTSSLVCEGDIVLYPRPTPSTLPSPPTLGTKKKEKSVCIFFNPTPVSQIISFRNTSRVDCRHIETSSKK